MPKYHLEILSSADALPTIEFLGDVNDEARHSSMTNAAKWTKGITPLADEASGYEFIHGQKNLRTLNDSGTTLQAANFKVAGGVLALANNGKNDAVFSFPKLTLDSGKLGNFYAKGTILDGSIVITASSSFGFKFASQLFEVVDFTIDRQNQISVIGDKGLMSVFKVDDRQPTVGYYHIIIGKYTRIIMTAPS